MNESGNTRRTTTRQRTGTLYASAAYFALQFCSEPVASRSLRHFSIPAYYWCVSQEICSSDGGGVADHPLYGDCLDTYYVHSEYTLQTTW